jgi:hypothetical protein
MITTTSSQPLTELTTGAARVTPSPNCTDPVRRACMIHRWENLTFLHWRYEPEAIQRLLPPGYAVECFDGSAWVGLVPFEMVVRPPYLPAVPWLSRFPETNVRTYVTAPDGSTGVWFLSLDASRLHAVLGARATYALPYYWSSMDVRSIGPVVTYRSRRGPATHAARSDVAIEVGAPFGAGELTDLDHWLTARYRLFTVLDHGDRFARAEHVPWLLHHARALHCDSDLIVAAGLPTPTAPPLVHWSPGVEVRIGTPQRMIATR